MAFLFKSKKNHDRSAAGSRDGPPVSQGLTGPGRLARDEKARATPTGSLNSLENDGNASPDGYATRRKPSGDNASPSSSDLPVREAPTSAYHSSPELTHKFAVSKRACDEQRWLISISLVATTPHTADLDKPGPVSAIWRRSQFRFIKGGRHICHRRPDK